MKHRVFALLSIVACLAVAISAVAQGSDPVSGTWSGDWGPSAGDRNKVTVQLKWDGKALTGSITGGDNVTSPIALTKTTYDAKTGAIHMEAEAKGRSGPVHYVVEGRVVKNEMIGSWSHDNRKGDFKLTKK